LVNSLSTGQVQERTEQTIKLLQRHHKPGLIHSSAVLLTSTYLRLD